MHYARGGRAARRLGGMMHPLSYHDMAKLVRAAGWRRPPVTREAGDASRYTSRLGQRSPPCFPVSSGRVPYEGALGVAAPLAHSNGPAATGWGFL
jgi:hypothetical protein